MNNIEIYNINKFKFSFLNNTTDFEKNPIKYLTDNPAYNTDNINNMDSNYFNDIFNMKEESDKLSCAHLNTLNHISYNNYDHNFLSNFNRTDNFKPVNYDFNKEHSVLKGQYINHKKFYDKINSNGDWIDMFPNNLDKMNSTIQFNQFTKKKSIS